jgi:hypothetical protein
MIYMAVAYKVCFLTVVVVIMGLNRQFGYEK